MKLGALPGGIWKSVLGGCAGELSMFLQKKHQQGLLSVYESVISPQVTSAERQLTSVESLRLVGITDTTNNQNCGEEGYGIVEATSSIL